MTEQSLVRADLLAELERQGVVTPTALVLLNPDMSLERYEALGALLGRLGSAVKWWAGDWLVFGEEVYGPLAAQAAEALGMSPEGMQDCIRVALAIPPDARRPGLSWSHHRRVAARWLSPEQRDRLLDYAEANGLASNELAGQVEALRERVALEEGDGSPAARSARPKLSAGGSRSRFRTGHVTAAECEELAEVALAELRDDLLACGFPAEALSLTVGTGSAALVVTVGTEEAAA